MSEKKAQETLKSRTQGLQTQNLVAPKVDYKRGTTGGDGGKATMKGIMTGKAKHEGESRGLFDKGHQPR
jgi:hypothetical protein